MKQYIGTNTVMAVATTLGDYNTHRGWTIPEDEDPATEGYLIKHPDGYQTWCPKAQFEKSYQSNGNYSFGHAMWLMEQGACVSRAGWNEKNVFLFLVQGSTFEVNREPLLLILGEGTIANYHGHIDMKTADGTIVPWTCSQTDMQAHDWGIVSDT